MYNLYRRKINGNYIRYHIDLYIVNGPYCSKHKFTKMTKIKDKEIDSYVIGGRGHKITHYEITYRCPKCGETIVIDEDR